MHAWRCLYKKAIDTSSPKYLNHVLIINFNGRMKSRSKSNVCPWIVLFCSNSMYLVLNGSTFKCVDYIWLCVTNLLDTILGFDAPHDAIWRIIHIHYYIIALFQCTLHLNFCTSLLLCTCRFGANFHPDAILSMVGADSWCGNQRRRESLPCFTTK